MIKTPKLYFCDTGLCAFLSSWTSRDTLLNGAASGHYLENYVVSEMLRNSSYGEKKVNLNFYRDTNQKEIDLVLEMDGQLHPFEIKRAASPDPKAIRAFSLLGLRSSVRPLLIPKQSELFRCSLKAERKSGQEGLSAWLQSHFRLMQITI